MTTFHYDYRPSEIVKPYMFQYVIDLRRLLTIAQRIYPTTMQDEFMDTIKSSIEKYMRDTGDMFTIEHMYDFIYMQTVDDSWLVMSKLQGHQWYRAIVETSVITS